MGPIACLNEVPQQLSMCKQFESFNWSKGKIKSDFPLNILRHGARFIYICNLIRYMDK